MKDKTPLIVFGCAGAVFLGVMVTATLFVVAAVRRPKTTEVAADPPQNNPVGRAQDPVGRAGDPPPDVLGRKFQKVEVADRRQADLMEMFPQAQSLARTVVPGAVLTNLVAFEVRGGTVNLDALPQNKPVYTFEFSGYDKSKPPGQDKVEATLWVHVDGENLAAWKIGAHATSLRMGRGLEPPRCSSKRAWKTAVDTGVPTNAVATFHYYDNKAFSPQSPNVWSIRVEGHDEYRREIDGRTCELVKRWDNAATPASTGGRGKRRRKP
jgi:hypothetical protein